jgi:hypothetical protein
MDLQSAGVITFGPEGCYLLATPKAVFAVDLNDNKPVDGSDRVQLQGIDFQCPGCRCDSSYSKTKNLARQALKVSWFLKPGR